MNKPTRSSIIKLGALSLTGVFLFIEFFDELSYAIDGAVLPVMRTELALSYAQVGLLLGLPHIIGTLIEPFIMLLGDTHLRKRLVIGGGLTILISLVLIARATSFQVLLLAFCIGFPASGAFVTLSQASLVDANPGREPNMMARWTLAGSLGNLIGPLFVAGGFAIALGWRWIFLVLAIMAITLVILVSWSWQNQLGTSPSGKPVLNAIPLEIHDLHSTYDQSVNLNIIWKNLGEAVRNPRLLRWIILLQLSDMLLDVLTGYTPLYLTDVVGVTPAQASLLLSLLMLSSLIADIVLIPLLEHIPGRLIVRLSAALSIPLYAMLLLVPWPLVKIGLLIILRLSTIGWYSVLQGEAYASIPGRSGTVMAINSVSSLLGGGITWLVGFVASLAGLPAGMWLLILGPASLVLFVPRPGDEHQSLRNRV
jgi:FSR family fosmidomycin resistance protein-like MFS transporter